MPDGMFEFATNLPSVAAQVEQGMGRIHRAMRAAQTQVGGSKVGPTANLEQQFMGGVRQRLLNVGAGLDRSLTNLGRDLEQRIRRGENVNVGREVRNLVRSTDKQLTAVAQDVARGIPAPLRSKLPELQSILNNGASEIIRAAESTYAQMAQNMRRIAAQVGNRNVSTPGIRRSQQGLTTGVIAGDPGGQQSVLRRFERAVDLQQRGAGTISEADRAAARQGILGGRGAGLPKAESSRLVVSAEKEAEQIAREALVAERKHQAEVRQAERERLAAEREQARQARLEAATMRRERAAAVRVFRQAQQNQGAGGRPRDLTGARYDRPTGMWYDDRGRAYEPVRGGEGLRRVDTQLQQTSRPGDIRGLEPRDPDNFNINRAHKELISEQRANEVVNQDLQKKLHVERQRTVQLDRQRAQQEAQAASRRLANELRAGQAVRLQGSNIVRDKQGGYYQVGGRGATPVDPRSAHLQQAVRRNEEIIQQQAEREATASRRRAREVAAAERGGGAGGGGPRRPGAQGFFDRAFGPGGGGTGRAGFKVDDLLTTGLSFGRYVASAAAFGAIAVAIKEIKEATLDYRDSLTNLNVALGRNESASRGFIDNLSETSRLVGENPGAALDAAARGVFAFGASLDSLEGKEALGEQFADAVSQLSVIADKPLKDASGDVIAIANNFGIASDNLQRVNDAIAASKINVGGDPKEIAQGLASLGSAAEAAGFSLEQTSDIVALVQSRTDQTGRAVATRLARVFSIVGGSAGRGAISKLNQQLSDEDQVNTNATVAEQIRQLGAVYNDLSLAQQSQLRSALGGTANTKELIPLLKEQELLQEALGKSYSEAGEGLDEFNRKTQDLRGTVTKISGDVQRIVVELGEAGLFDLFGLAIEAIEPFLNALVQVLEVYNALPAPMKSVLAITLQLAAAQKLYGMYLSAKLGAGSGIAVRGSQGIGVLGARSVIRERSRLGRLNRGANFDSPLDEGYRGRVPVSRVPGAVYGPLPPHTSRRQRLAAFGARPLPALYGAGRSRIALGIDRIRGGTNFPRARGFFGDVGARRAELRAGGAGGLRGGRMWAFGSVSKEAITANGSLRRLTTGFKGMVNSIDPLTASIVGVIAVISAWNAANRTIEATNTTQGLTGQNVTGDLRDEIVRRQSQIDESRQARRGVFGGLTDYLNNSQGARAEADLQEEIDRLIEAADTIDERRAKAAGERSVSDTAAAIDVTTEGGIGEGLELLQSTGRNAVTQINALNEAMRALADRANETASTLSPGQRIEFEQLAGTNVQSTLSELQELYGGRRGAVDDFLDPIIDPVRSAAGGVLGNIPFLNRFAPTPLRDIDQGLADAVGGVDQEKFGSNFNDIIQRYLQGTGGELSDAQLEELTDLGMNALRGAGLEGLNPEQAKQLRGEVRNSLKNTRGGLEAIEDISAQFSEYLEAAATLAQNVQDQVTTQASLAGSGPAALAGIDAKIRELEKAKATAARDDATSPGQLEEITLLLQEAELERIEALQQRIDLLAASESSQLPTTDVIGRQQLQLEALQDKLSLTRDVDQRIALETEIADAERALAQSRVERANAETRASFDSRDTVGTAYAEAVGAYRSLQAIIDQGDTSSAAYHDARREYAEAILAQETAERERLAAYRQALVDPRNVVENTQVELRNLWDQYNAALPGSTEQHELTRQINETNQRLREEQVAVANAQANAGVDPASQLQQAQVGLANARRELSLALPGTAQYYDSLKALRDAQVALVDAELQAASVRQQLAIDLTDPVATARQSLQAVRAQIRAATARGAPEDVVNSLRVEEQQAQASLEAAAFQQRLSDVQTAEQLGRISHSAYIRYLENESSRLGAIANRTRQQQEQLNQIDLLLKEATETAAGQWNIGDIKLPTPYEVRRAIEAQAQGMTLGESFRDTQSVNATRVTNDNRQAHIQIYGTEIEEVKALIAEYFGPSTLNRSSTGVSGGRT